MRPILTGIFLYSALLSLGQSNWGALFRNNPESSDGFFIVDQDKANAQGVEQVKVEILATEILPNGVESTRVIEVLTIDETFYGRANFSLWDQLNEPFRIHYRAQGLNALGDVVTDVQSLCNGCSAWPEVCRETCESNLYAYTLVAYSDGAQAVVELHEGTVNGEYTRVYVKASDWQAFQNMFDPWEHFGIGGGTWSQILIFAQQGVEPYATDVIRLEYPNQMPPPGARDYMGYPIGPVTQNVYAVKKGKGPWQDFYATTEVLTAQAVCNGQGAGHLRTVYNADDLVEDALSTYSLPPLTCQGMMMSGGGLSWGSGYNDWCTEYHFEEQTWGDPPNYLTDVTISVIGCVHVTFGFDPSGVLAPSGTGPNGTYTLADVANIVVSQWSDIDRTEVISVPVKGVGDPKLLKVTKTEVPGGLYDFMVIMNDGRILRRFIEFEGPTVLNADFAAFTNVNIYPVPVRDTRFAVDFDLAVATSVSLTIVNNQGNTFYTKALSFDKSGLNKHVVETGSPWPNGLYHAVFQYPDGSSESVSFTVEH
ncbi:MAG: hypothetical protein R2817_09495 [Flavobacteriales bacterium]